LVQDIVVADVQKEDQLVAFIVPDDADIHVDAALKQVLGPLDALGAQGWVHGIFGEQLQFGPKLLFFLGVQTLKSVFQTA
jgi:hypothetical protein